MRIGIAVYGYLKTVAALETVKQDVDVVSFNQASEVLLSIIRQVHDQLSWEISTKKKAEKVRLSPC